MYDIFKTVLVLSVLGFFIIAVLLVIKPVTSKKFPAEWQYIVWIAVLFCMLIPIWKLIPEKEVSKIRIYTPPEEAVELPDEGKVQIPETIVTENMPIEYRKVSVSPSYSIRVLDLAAYIWFFGMCVFLLASAISYAVFLSKKRKSAVAVMDNKMLEEVKKELNVKRKIRIRISEDIKSPMLSGIIFPIVYVPCRKIPDEHMRMIFLHELTHYKRRDLIVKWLSLFVNAVHWFNPLSYLLSANINESCEISCDMEVTKNMDNDEQKLYMKTILDLV